MKDQPIREFRDHTLYYSGKYEHRHSGLGKVHEIFVIVDSIGSKEIDSMVNIIMVDVEKAVVLKSGVEKASSVIIHALSPYDILDQYLLTPLGYEFDDGWIEHMKKQDEADERRGLRLRNEDFIDDGGWGGKFGEMDMSVNLSAAQEPIDPEQLYGNGLLITDKQTGEKIRVDYKELIPFLKGLRKKIAEKLKQKMTEKGYDPDLMEVVDKTLYGENIFLLESGKVFKRNIRDLESTSIDFEHTTKALKKLYSLPHHPNIAYSLLQKDPRNEKDIPDHTDFMDQEFYFGEGAGSEIQQRMDIITIAEILRQKEKSALEEVLVQIRDCMEGAEFLIENNLVLGDICLENMAIDKKTNQSKLFDFEGLFENDGTERTVLYHPGYNPPEHYYRKAPVTEYEMVYQFGIGLEKVLTAYGINSQDYYPYTIKDWMNPGIYALTKLIYSMTYHSTDIRYEVSEKRPTFKKALEILDSEVFPLLFENQTKISAAA